MRGWRRFLQCRPDPPVVTADARAFPSVSPRVMTQGPETCTVELMSILAHEGCTSPPP